MSYNLNMDVKAFDNVKYIKIWLLIIALALTGAALLGNIHYFEVVAVDNGDVIFSARVRPGFRFSTTFKHSVQLSDWTDFFEITKDWQFKLYETHFADMGWGFPSEPDPGAKMEMTDEYIRYYDMNRLMESFQVAVTTANDRHFLVAGDLTVDLVKEAGPGRLLDFRIRRWRLIN